MRLKSEASALDVLRWLYDFHAWARPRLLTAIHQLGDADLRRSGVIGGGHGDGSVLATIVHMVDAEESWLLRWQGRGDELPDPANYGDLATIANTWAAVDRSRNAFLDGLDSGKLAGQALRITSMEAPLWQVLLHVANHSTQHRAEICVGLTALGVQPASMDVADFVRATQRV